MLGLHPPGIWGAAGGRPEEAQGYWGWICRVKAHHRRAFQGCWNCICPVYKEDQEVAPAGGR